MVVLGVVLPAGAGVSRRNPVHHAPTFRPPRRRGGQPAPRRRSDGCLASSPQARGSAAVRAAPKPGHRVLPAGAGVSRCCDQAASRWSCPPRRRGGQPAATTNVICLAPSSPQARGSAGRPGPVRGARGVLPAGAGVSRLTRFGYAKVRGPPRRRGGQPLPRSPPSAPPRSSPQARGSAVDDVLVATVAVVLPAGAGVSRRGHRGRRGPARPPRRRGGQPDLGRTTASLEGSSPQARGSAAAAGRSCGRGTVLPAGAGVSRSEAR